MKMKYFFSAMIFSCVLSHAAAVMAENNSDFNNTNAQGYEDASPTTMDNAKQAFSDSMITAKVKALLIQKKIFSEKDIEVLGIHVETRDGLVYLSGRAVNQVQVDNAVKIAKSVAGVKGVTSVIVVSKPIK